MDILTVEEIEALPRDYLKVKEAAAVMGVSANTLYKQAKKMQMPFPVLRVGKSIRIPKIPFISYMRTGHSDIDR